MKPKPKSLKELLLVHQLAFVLLILLTAGVGTVEMWLWQKTSQESLRINVLIQEIQQTRGDLYRQMKELFDAYFLDDPTARREYADYTKIVNADFSRLFGLTHGEEEHAAIVELQNNYAAFLNTTGSILERYSQSHDEKLQRALNTDIENGVFTRYELVSANAEKLLNLKQKELQYKLHEAKYLAVVFIVLPIGLATLLLLFSRIFLQRAILRPFAELIRATNEISTGNLQHKAPENGAEELVTLSRSVNQMAAELALSREALIRSEKQAAQGALVPMLAHNIRNPLASIRATAQVAETPEMDEELRESLQGIISTVDRLERWTGGLLAYLHPLKPQISIISLKQIIEGAISPLQIKLKEKCVTIEFTNSCEYTIRTDEHLLEQALYNLLLNGLDASPRNSKITITCDEVDDQLTIKIHDAGAGMPFIPEMAGLGPGPSTKRYGTGLGIPFAFKVCEALGGQLKYIKPPAGGTLVQLSLPVLLKT